MALDPGVTVYAYDIKNAPDWADHSALTNPVPLTLCVDEGTAVFGQNRRDQTLRDLIAAVNALTAVLNRPTWYQRLATWHRTHEPLTPDIVRFIAHLMNPLLRQAVWIGVPVLVALQTHNAFLTFAVLAFFLAADSVYCHVHNYGWRRRTPQERWDKVIRAHRDLAAKLDRRATVCWLLGMKQAALTNIDLAGDERAFAQRMLGCSRNPLHGGAGIPRRIRTRVRDL